MINCKYEAKLDKKNRRIIRVSYYLSKSFEAGYKKTADVFSKEEITEFLETVPNTEEFIHIKAY